MIETWKPLGVSLMLTARLSPGFIFNTSLELDGGPNDLLTSASDVVALPLRVTHAKLTGSSPNSNSQSKLLKVWGVTVWSAEKLSTLSAAHHWLGSQLGGF